MENHNHEEKLLQEIENLGPFFVDDVDMTLAVISKIKNVIIFIANNEQISFSEAYQNVKSSPVYSLLTDDYIETLYSNVGDIYNAYKELQNRKQR